MEGGRGQEGVGRCQIFTVVVGRPAGSVEVSGGTEEKQGEEVWIRKTSKTVRLVKSGGGVRV